jgi:hypothetical protein
MIRIIRSKETSQTVWLQDPNEVNGDNLNNVRCEASRYFRNKKKECLKDKINELAVNSKNKDIDLYREINENEKSIKYNKQFIPFSQPILCVHILYLFHHNMFRLQGAIFR